MAKASASASKSHRAGGGATQQQRGRGEPVGFIEWLIPAVGFTGSTAKFAYDAWKQGRPPIKPEQPLVFAVDDCVATAGEHVLSLTCRNLGAHGVYLESVAVIDPKRHPAPTAGQPPGASMSFNGAEPFRPLPFHVASGDEIKLQVTLQRFDADRLSRKPYGTLRWTHTVLGVAASPATTDTPFAVRR